MRQNVLRMHIVVKCSHRLPTNDMRQSEGDTSELLLRCLWVSGCAASRGEDSSFNPSHWLYCAFDSLDHYHDGFIVPGIWQTKSRKWLGVTQGIWRGMGGGGAPERDCVSPGEGRGGEGGQGAFTVYLSVSTVQTSEQSLAPHPGIVLCCLCASLMSAGGGGGRDVCSYLLHSER